MMIATGYWYHIKIKIKIVTIATTIMNSACIKHMINIIVLFACLPCAA